MTTATIQRVDDVTDHPEAPTNSIVRLDNGKQCISGKLDDGSPRYISGDLVVFVADAAIVPLDLLRPGFWNEAENKGSLKGPLGNRVKAGNFKKVMSEGILFEVWSDDRGPFVRNTETGLIEHVTLGQDVSAILGVTPWTPG